MSGQPFDISIEISAGKKDLTVIPEDGGYTLQESGSIVAVIKQREGNWQFTKGSYSENDAAAIGAIITTKMQKP